MDPLSPTQEPQLMNPAPSPDSDGNAVNLNNNNINFSSIVFDNLSTSEKAEQEEEEDKKEIMQRIQQKISKDFIIQVNLHQKHSNNYRNSSNSTAENNHNNDNNDDDDSDNISDVTDYDVALLGGDNFETSSSEEDISPFPWEDESKLIIITETANNHNSNDPYHTKNKFARSSNMNRRSLYNKNTTQSDNVKKDDIGYFKEDNIINNNINTNNLNIFLTDESDDNYLDKQRLVSVVMSPNKEKFYNNIHKNNDYIHKEGELKIRQRNKKDNDTEDDDHNVVDVLYGKIVLNSIVSPTKKQQPSILRKKTNCNNIIHKNIINNNKHSNNKRSSINSISTSSTRSLIDDILETYGRSNSPLPTTSIGMGDDDDDFEIESPQKRSFC